MIMLQYPGVRAAVKNVVGKSWWLIPIAYMGYCWACLCMRLGGKVPVVINGVKHSIPTDLIVWRKGSVIIYEDLDERRAMEASQK
jgi:hypothetical protein